MCICEISSRLLEAPRSETKEMMRWWDGSSGIAKMNSKDSGVVIVWELRLIQLAITQQLYTAEAKEICSPVELNGMVTEKSIAIIFLCITDRSSAKNAGVWFYWNLLVTLWNKYCHYQSFKWRHKEAWRLAQGHIGFLSSLVVVTQGPCCPERKLWSSEQDFL